MKVIIANWKMNVGVRESVALARATLLMVRGRKRAPDVVMCPPFVALSEVRKVVARSSAALGAQNMFWKETGAFTGETSSRMLAELGVTHVILGHAERRHQLGETDTMIHQKVAHALETGLTPILCVGETSEERRSGSARDVVQRQFTSALASVQLRPATRVMIAYEPVWAVGSGEACSAPEAVEMHRFIRSMVHERYPSVEAARILILYGGSVDGSNAYGYLREREVDGLLVGGASVKVNQFKEIVDAACEVLEAQAV